MTVLVLVFFTACTGVIVDTTPLDGGNWFIVVGYVCGLFWHDACSGIRLPVP